MTESDRVSMSSKAVGARISAARETAGLTQQELCDAIGIPDRQTLSTIETGDRRVKSDELARVSRVLGRPMEWFIDPFVITGQARFSWRVSKSISSETLEEFESRVGQIVGLLRHLRVAMKGPSKALGRVLMMSSHPTYEDAWNAGEAVAKELELGTVPALSLIERIESKLDLTVLFVDAGAGTSKISGAMCRLPEMGVILINRQESLVRRNYDVAHELFHALTWDIMAPQHREDPDSIPPLKARRIEQLADNFAAAVLMPTSSLKELIDPARFNDVEHLSEIAQQLQVSAYALAYRLFNAKMIDLQTREGLKSYGTPRAPAATPKLLSETFATLLHDGIARGHVSARKAAKALSVDLAGLASLLQEHGKPIPFAA